MLTFAQYISEANVESLSDRLKKLKKLNPPPKALGRVASSSSFKWFTSAGLAGWYNVNTEKGMSFVWKMNKYSGNYHITQVAKDPKFFGLTDDNLLSLIKKDTGGSPDDLLDTLKDLRAGKGDSLLEIDDYLMKQGWVKIQCSKDETSITADSRGNLKAVVMAAMQQWKPRIPWGNIALFIAVPYRVFKPLEDLEAMERFVEKS